MEELKTIPILIDADVVVARATARELAKSLGFGSADQTRLATAVSELTRNVLRYAEKGECHVWDDSDEQLLRIRVVVEDHGPGIADLDAAMGDGYTTGGGLGAGLPGTKRLVHEFDLKSRPGETQVSIAVTARKRVTQTVAMRRLATG